MTDYRQRIIDNLCYTELVYQRINGKLDTNFSKEKIESFIEEVLKKTDERFYLKTGKNYYVTNTEHDIRITINSNTFRVITVDRIMKKNNASTQHFVFIEILDLFEQ